jgi:hypothetical protein
MLIALLTVLQRVDFPIEVPIGSSHGREEPTRSDLCAFG